MNLEAIQSALWPNPEQGSTPDSQGASCRACGRRFFGCNAEVILCGQCLLGSALEAPDWPEHPSAHTALLLAEASWLGPYALLEEIGRGGMGVIYRAVHHLTGQEVAVKTVLPEYARCTDTVTRFYREAEAAQTICHPHSMPVLEVGRSADGATYFSMPLATGGSLHDQLGKYRGRWRQTAEVLGQVASAVHHAHQQGILHRDLKPGNILFTEDHEPLITDFGLVKQLVEPGNLTYSHTVLGTPNYVAPEQAAGKNREISAAADVYSLGAILFELLAGRPPFVGENALDVLHQAAKQTPPRPRSLVASIPAGLETICLRCLERDPQARYRSADDLVLDLRRWLDGRRIAASPLHVRVKKGLRANSLWLQGALPVCALLWLAGFLFRGQANITAKIPLAITLETLDQGDSFGGMTQRVMQEMRRRLVAQGFRLSEDPTDRIHPLAEGFDPLAYGRDHNAELVLAGSMRREGQTVRLVERLLRCSTGETVWRWAMNLPMRGAQDSLLLWAQTMSENARRIVVSPAKEMDQPDHVPLPEAQAFYTRAMEVSTRDDLRDLEDAVALFRRAADMDPKFAMAHATLAFALWTLADGYGQREKIPLALAAAKQALAIDPRCAQAHRVIASCYFKTTRNAEAYKEFWKAIDCNPRSAGCCVSLGIYLRATGRLDEAEAWMARAIQLAPSLSTLHAILGETLALDGQQAQAESVLRHAVELDGERPEPQFDLISLLVWRRDYDKARAECTLACLHFPQSRFGSTLTGWIELCAGRDSVATKIYEDLRAENLYQSDCKFSGAVNPDSALAYLALKAGSLQESQRLVREALAQDQEILVQFPHNPRILHDMAATYAVGGDTEQALRLLGEAILAGWTELASTRIDPRFSSLANSLAFRRLVEHPHAKEVLGKTVSLRSSRGTM